MRTIAVEVASSAQSVNAQSRFLGQVLPRRFLSPVVRLASADQLPLGSACGHGGAGSLGLRPLTSSGVASGVEGQGRAERCEVAPSGR